MGMGLINLSCHFCSCDVIGWGWGTSYGHHGSSQVHCQIESNLEKHLKCKDTCGLDLLL